MFTLKTLTFNKTIWFKRICDENYLYQTRGEMREKQEKVDNLVPVMENDYLYCFQENVSLSQNYLVGNKNISIIH